MISEQEVSEAGFCRGSDACAKMAPQTAAGACKRAPTLTARPELHLPCIQYAPELCPCAEQGRTRPQWQPAGGNSGNWVPSPLSPMHPLAPKSRAHISAWETLEHPWLGPGAIDRGGRLPLALRANPRLHPSRWEGPCPPPPCSHPTHPPTVQPQLLRAGAQGNRGQVGAGCRQRAPRNLIPAASPLPCGHLAAHCPFRHTAAHMGLRAHKCTNWG